MTGEELNVMNAQVWLMKLLTIPCLNSDPVREKAAKAGAPSGREGSLYKECGKIVIVKYAQNKRKIS